MNAAHVGNSSSYLSQYVSRLQRALGSASDTVATRAVSWAPLSITEITSPTILHTVLRYVIYALILVFIVLLILTIVHYTVKPIFGVPGDSALITVSAGDWARDWTDTSVQYSDVPAKKPLPKTNYTVLFDMRILTPMQTVDTGNRFVVAYKTTAGQAGQAAIAGSTTGGTGGGSQTVQCTSATTRGDTSVTTTVQPITGFPFLNSNSVPPNGDPSLLLLYDTLTSVLEARLVTRDRTGDILFVTVSADVVPNTPYRVGVVVTDTILELYINGRLASSLPYTGKTPAGGENDAFYSTPALYNKNIEIRNLFTLTRVANPGEIANFGGAAL